MRSHLTLLAFVCVAPTFLCLAAPTAAPSKPAAHVQKWGIPDIMQCGLPGPLGVTSYDGRIRTCRYVLEVLNGRGTGGDRSKATFRPDPAWPVEFRASLEDYRSIAGEYDRGHLAPAGDFAATAKLEASFLLSNMAPQHPQLNRGIWRVLENYLRETATRKDVSAVWVVTMPLFMPDDTPPRGEPTSRRVSYQVAGPNHVPVPTHFAKSALIENVDGRVAIRTWLFPNAAPPPGGVDLNSYRVPTDLVEHWAGLDLWEGVSDELEGKLEAAE